MPQKRQRVWLSDWKVCPRDKCSDKLITNLFFFIILKSVYFQFYGASVHSQEKFQSKSCHRSVCFVFFFTKSEVFSFGEEWENVFCHEFASERPKGLSALFRVTLKNCIRKCWENLQNIHSISTDQLQGVGWTAAGFLLV